MATTYDLTGTNAEFIYNYSGNGAAYDNVLSAFGTSASTIVSVTLTGAGSVGQTINAGSFAHLTDKVSTINYPTTFDIGFSSSAAATSAYTTASGSLVTGASPTSTSNAVEGYGTLELGSGTYASTNFGGISMKGAYNTLILDTTTPAVVPMVTGFGAAGDQIVFNGVTAAMASIVGYSNGVLSYSNNGVVYTASFAGMPTGAAAGNFSIGSVAAIEGGNSSAYSGNLVIGYVPCFLRGTMIDTPFGERAVESLQAGDSVLVLLDGRMVSRSVTWTGGSTMHVADHDFADEAFPVRIRRGAFADNRPHRDLLVTPEHCILTENGLTPARMLVNGGSILVDRRIVEYDFFHVELETHSILLSEGLPTESYLAGENRRFFGDDIEIAERALAAPLAVAQSMVEPVWAALADRALALGFAAPALPALTSDPSLRLLLDDGSEIAACLTDAQRHMFHIPRGARPVRLRSRAGVPARTVGPFMDDRRSLGVAVDRLVLWNGLDQQTIPVAALNQAGWHADDGESRWTDGDATLILPAAGAEAFLDVHLVATTLYSMAG